MGMRDMLGSVMGVARAARQTGGDVNAALGSAASALGGVLGDKRRRRRADGRQAPVSALDAELTQPENGGFLGGGPRAGLY